MQQQQKQKQSQNSNQKPKFLDANQIMYLYRLSHINLDMALKNLKAQIDQEFDTFKNTLLSSLNSINYLRYMQAYPNDDIKFIFKETVHASLSQERLDQKRNILERLANFQLIKQGYGGIADNCLWQVNQFLNSKKPILNLKQIIPSGFSFITKQKQKLDQFLPLWKNLGNQVNIASVFKQISPTFPKGQISKLGSILAQANKSVISAKLLFRASQHNFQSSQFKEICAGHGDTLLLAKSDKGKVFGAYTPCKWLNTKEKQFVGDPSAQSFLFSLDNSMMFPIKRNQLDYAISAYGGWGPIYGSPYGPDLSISDKCNVNDHSCSSLGSHYQIPVEIKQYSNEAFALLGGAKKFKVLEYQIYELILK